MFTTFSGNTRKPRQVNLGGRKTHAFGSSGAGTGSQAALDRAQQERVQRQRDRELLQAAQTLQRTWRGHASRQKLSGVLRQEWDAVEGPDASSRRQIPYESEDEAYAQLQRLIHFVSIRNEEDDYRIRHFLSRQAATTYKLNSSASSSWASSYLRLERMVLAVLNRRCNSSSAPEDYTEDLIVLRFLAEQIPAETSQNAHRFYETIAYVIREVSAAAAVTGTEPSSAIVEVILEAATLPLTRITGYTLKAYEAFTYNVLPIPIMSTNGTATWATRLRQSFAAAINSKLLASALAASIRGKELQAHPVLTDAESRLRLLGVFIYFHRYTHSLRSADAYLAHKDFVATVAVLLNSLPTDIADNSSDVQDDGKGANNAFINEMIASLVNQEGVGNLLAGSSGATGGSDEEKMEEARQLANYALALLRFFPRRGDEIRMWLYLGPSGAGSDQGKRHLPAIRYFWRASKRSSIFRIITRDSRAAIRLLKSKTQPAQGQSLGQYSSWQAPTQEIHREAAIADEWRVILVFLELYTFVLKVTDDEEFFTNTQDDYSGQIRDNSLPLAEVKDLTTFLKNLGFTLYFNASDINEAEERDTSSAGLTFFNPSSTVIQPQKQIEPSVGGVAGLTLDYVKGLVTGLLRMVYERDSRRKFLPSEHWLMTSRFEMGGFIHSVVEEEENRHKIQEEDAEDVDDEEEEEFDATPQLIGTGRTQQQRRLDRLQRQQRKASRRRYLQAVAPRLEILQNMPFFIPFTTRVQIFREFVHLDMTKRRGSSDPEVWRVRAMLRPDASQHFDKHTARIRREHEFDDAFSQFYELGQGLKEPIQITFVDQFDQPEAGIDGGGVTKEFLTSVTKRAFLPTDDIEMFVENDQHLLYPNPSAVEEVKERLRQGSFSESSTTFRSQVQAYLQRYEFLGRIVGKCLYEGILVDVNFAPFFLRKWALTGGTGSAPNESGYRPTLNDLRDLDEALYQGLYQLKIYTGDVEDFALNFTVTDNITVDHASKKTKSITKDLKADGANTAVTNQNRLVYISYMARHRLQNQPYLQTSAFLRGLGSMIQPSWLSMFNQAELQTLIGGTSSAIDVEDLRRNTLYGGTYVIGDDGLEHPTVQLFWKVMKELSDGERRAVLKFVTSTPRAPLLGFSTLTPRFSIRDAGSDQERLPSTSTCVNLMKLPMYSNERVLKEKLLYSVFSGAGFDLS